LKYATFKNLRILRLHYGDPSDLVKFLENNGKSLEEFEYYSNSEILNMAIAKFCLNLKFLYTRIAFDELETFITILNNCQQLERIKIRCNGCYIKENDVLNIVAKYSPKNFHELILLELIKSDLLPEELESFFMIWKDHVPFKSITLIIEGYDVKKENMEIIEKYKELGIIKKFELIYKL